MSVEDEVTQKVGPLPAYAWAFMAAGGFVLYRYMQNRRASAVAAATTATDTSNVNTTTDPNAGTSYGALDTTPYVTDSTGVDATGNSVATTVTTNAQWIAEAEQGLLHSGHDPIHILKALQDFIAGRTLTYSEQQIVDAAVARYGMPPEGNADVTNLPGRPKSGPRPKPKPKEKTVEVTVGPFASLGTLAQRYYGNAGKWDTIKQANRNRLPAHAGPFTNLKNGIRLTIPNATRGF